MKVPVCFDSPQVRVMAIIAGRGVAGFRDGAGPYGVDLVAGKLVIPVALVEDNEQRCFLLGEEFAAEYLRDQLGKIGVAAGDGAVMNVVAEVGCQPHEVGRGGG